MSANSTAKRPSIATPTINGASLNKKLTALLIVQALVLASVWMFSNRKAAVFPVKRLIPNLDAAKVSAIRIEDEKHKVLELKKSTPTSSDNAAPGSAQWTLASSGDFLAKNTSVNEFIAKLVGLKVQTPISSKNTHYEKLGVSDEGYKRKLGLTYNDGTTAELIVGTPGSDRRTPVRIVGNDSVYAVSGMSPFDIATTESSWIDSSYVKFDKAQVTSLHVKNRNGTLSFSKSSPTSPPSKKNTWTIAGGVHRAMSLKTSAIDGLVSSLSNLSMKAPVARVGGTIAELTPYGLDNPLAEIVVTVSSTASKTVKGTDAETSGNEDISAAVADGDLAIRSDETTAGQAKGDATKSSEDANSRSAANISEKIRLLIGKKEEDSYYAKRDDRSFIVKVGKWTVDDFINKKKTDFFEDKTVKSTAVNPTKGPPGAIDVAGIKSKQVLRPQAGASGP